MEDAGSALNIAGPPSAQEGRLLQERLHPECRARRLLQDALGLGIVMLRTGTRRSTTWTSQIVNLSRVIIISQKMGRCVINLNGVWDALSVDQSLIWISGPV